ncbi:MAG: 3'-5' exonuclease [Myxococcota bacterium]
MNKPYLVVDLEATCDQHHGIPRQETEIIEIGAVLVDRETLEPQGEFQTFVRPVIHPQITEFCTELTSITQDNVDGAPRFAQAMAELSQWLPRPVTMASWGAYDHNQFRTEARRRRVTLPWGNDHFNIKEAFAKRFGRRMGVSGALRRVGLTFDGRAHRGIDDARNIVRLLPHALGVAQAPSRGDAHTDTRGRSRRRRERRY